MQGDKLGPGHQNVLGRSLRPGTPHRRRGDRESDSLHHIDKVACGQVGSERLGIEHGGMGRDIDQSSLDALGIGVAELERGQLLKVVVQKPGMVQRGLQDQRLASRNRGAMAAMNRA
jgi:hypothetical protein